jgi:hypothetical protein
MKPHLCKAGVQLREQIDDHFPDRDRRSDGWIGDARHAATKSDHNPLLPTLVVRAIDVDSDLGGAANTTAYLANQIRIAAKTDKRIAYVIFNHKIASPILNWKFRKYSGIDPHTSHLHISFTAKGDDDGSFFEIPLLGGKI